MKKIPTMFRRDFQNHKVIKIYDEFTNEDCETALRIGEATLKIDGAACAVFNGQLYKRFDFGKAKKIPEGRKIIFCESGPDPITGHWPAWILCERLDPADKWFYAAWENYFSDWKPNGLDRLDWTYEAIGPHFQGNPYHLEKDTLSRHGKHNLASFFPRGYRIGKLARAAQIYPRTFEGVKNFLEDHTCEGIVFWLHGKPCCKIKRSDFGLPWPGKE